MLKWIKHWLIQRRETDRMRKLSAEQLLIEAKVKLIFFNKLISNVDNLEQCEKIVAELWKIKRILCRKPYHESCSVREMLVLTGYLMSLDSLLTISGSLESVHDRQANFSSNLDEMAIHLEEHFSSLWPGKDQIKGVDR